MFSVVLFFFQAEDGIRDLVRSRGLGDVYKRQSSCCAHGCWTVDVKYCAALWQNCKFGISGVGVGFQLERHFADAIFQRLGAHGALLQALDQDWETEGRRSRALHQQQFALRHARQRVRQARRLELAQKDLALGLSCLLYTSPSPRDRTRSRMPSSA